MTRNTRTIKLSDLTFRPLPAPTVQRPAQLCQPCSRVSSIRRSQGTADVKGGGRS